MHRTIIKRSDHVPPFRITDESRLPIDLTGISIEVGAPEGTFIPIPSKYIDAKNGSITLPTEITSGIYEFKLIQPNGTVHIVASNVELV
jgi:hypothetical protein